VADKTVAYNTDVAASATVDNILQGTILATAPGFGQYHIYGRQETGVGTLIMSINVAGELCGEDLPINAAAGAPVKPDDHLASVKVAQGDIVLVKLRETAGTATLPNIRIEFQEMSPAQLRMALAGR